MQILITGGAGFVGTNLIKRLLNEGHNVTSIDNYNTGLKSNHQKGCKYLDHSVEYSFESYNLKPDIVYHLAAIARIQPSFKHPEEYINVNFNGTYEIVKYCTQNNIPLIYAGSSSHHSGKFKNPYTFSKDMGEEIIQLYRKHFKLRASIVRFYNVYGPHQLKEGGYTTLIGKWIGNIEKDIPCEIYGDGEKRRDFTHVDDIVDGLCKIYKKGEFKYDYELGRGKNYSINEVAKMFGINPIYKKDKPGEAQTTLCKSFLAAGLLKWKPKINLEDYIKTL
jgi:UDP-glucose 4-epimerase